MHVWSNKWGYKIYFVIAPGGDPGDILLDLSGQDSLTVDQLGELKGWIGNKHFRFPHAIAYQEYSGQAELVSWSIGYHESLNDHLVNFDLGSYNTSQNLIIDISEADGPSGPERDAPYPEWGTYYGGGNGDEVVRMESIAHGGIVSCGRTWSVDFPVTAGLFVGDGSNSDGFITYFDQDYIRQMSTVFGGFGDDGFQAVKYGFNGHFIAAGYYQSDVTDAVWQDPGGGAFVDASEVWGRKVAICEFTEGGTRIWSTTFGSNLTCDEYDDRRLVANLDINSEGDVILVGNLCAGGSGWPSLPTTHTNQPSDGEWPITGGGYTQDYMPHATWVSEGPKPVHYDGWIARFKPNRQLVWSTLFGGSSYLEGITDLAIDTSTDQVFLSGWTTSPDGAGSCTGAPLVGQWGFPWCSFTDGYNEQPLYASGSHHNCAEQAFVAAFNDQNALIWCTPFGKAFGRASAISVSRSFALPFSSVAIVGTTQQEVYSTGTECEPPLTGWPLCNTSNPFTADLGDTETIPNGFVVRFDADTKELTWSTALTHLEPKDVTSYERTVYVGANPLGPIEPAFLADEADFFTALDPGDAGSQLVLGFDQYGLFYGSKYGGIGSDQLVAVAMNPEGRYYVAGQADIPALFPLKEPPQTGDQPPWYVENQSGGGDIFYGQLKIITPQVVVVDDSAALNRGGQAFPCPTDGLISITASGKTLEPLLLTVVDALGRVVVRESAQQHAGKVVLDVSGLSNGTYRARLSLASGETISVAPFAVAR